MNMKNLNFEKLLSSKHQNQVKFGLALLSSLIVVIVFYFTEGTNSDSPTSTNDSMINLNVMIPDGYVLFSFQADNYEQISPFLEPYSMVKVYSINTGEMIAQNIKVLRAPKDPSQLSFLVPVNIANYFAHFGLEYRIVLQKYDSSKRPQIVNKTKQKQRVSITFGGFKNENL
jgi:hypothetical protein